ncbi:MAG: TraB/GumN family protein [Yoonia sp.]|uniref:TraB/GumN family protein n=1 Tax=Yoonia sp. TaxID=2212373 RepID=UPI003EF0C690
MALRAALISLLSLVGGPVIAACTGEGFYDSMTDAQRAELQATAAQIPYAQGLTWQAKKDDDTLTLIGTMHVYDPRLQIIRSDVAQTVQTADLVLLEATPTEEAQLKKAITDRPEVFFITDGATLPERLDEDTWQMVSAAANARGIPGFMAAKMQPWYLSLTLAVPPCAMTEIMAGMTGLDKMIITDAAAAGVPLQALEPYTTLFDMFTDESLEDQVDMLRVSMLVPDLQEQIFISMLDLYFAEEVGILWNMSRIAMTQVPDIDPAEGQAMFEEMQDGLLDQRNRAWMPVIAEATEAHDNIVVAVGAAHLIGDTGVLQLLENNGWTITRLP